jgi:hypothetical protein
MTRYLLLFDSQSLVFLWAALSDERMGLSFVHAGGPCQRSLSPVRVPWDSRSYFTISDLRLPFSSPPTTRRVTVEVFDPASTRVGSEAVCLMLIKNYEYYNFTQFYFILVQCRFLIRISYLIKQI